MAVSFYLTAPRLRNPEVILSSQGVVQSALAAGFPSQEWYEDPHYSGPGVALSIYPSTYYLPTNLFSYFGGRGYLLFMRAPEFKVQFDIQWYSFLLL